MATARPDRYKSLLDQVYDAQTAARLTEELCRRVARTPRIAGTGEEPLTERDVVLITYAHTLLSPDKKPLETLTEFYRHHLGDLISIVHLLPFYPDTSDDGFSVVDYRAVRADLGDWDDIGRLAGRVRLMFDAVINHVSQQSAWFQGYLDGDPAYRDYFLAVDPATDLSAVVRPRPQPVLAEFNSADGPARHVWATFSRDQLDLNYANPRVLLEIIDVLIAYLARGAQVLRLDAVAFLWKEIGTSCIHLPQTHALIKLMRAVLEDIAPHVLIITETNVPHDENVSYFGDGTDEAHMVYNFALPPLVAHSLLSGDATELSAWAASLNTPSERACFFNVTASHDGVGLRAVETILPDAARQALTDTAERHGGFVSYRAGGDGARAPYELNCSYGDLLSPPSDPDDVRAARLLASQAIALAMPGVPAIYIHSLLGSRNDHRRVAERGHNRAINRAQLAAASVAAALADKASYRARVFDAIAAMLRARRHCPAFHPHGPFQIVDLDPRVFAVRRHAPDGGQTVLALINVSPEKVTVATGGDGPARDLLGSTPHERSAVGLPPYGVVWLDQTDSHGGS